jgi:hypothetical protein
MIHSVAMITTRLSQACPLSLGLCLTSRRFFGILLRWVGDGMNARQLFPKMHDAQKQRKPVGKPKQIANGTGSPTLAIRPGSAARNRLILLSTLNSCFALSLLHSTGEWH